MRILHISNQLPDVRVEKTMLSDLKRGDDVGFLGNNLKTPVFSELENIKTYKFNLGLNQLLGTRKNKTLKQIKNALDNYDPDLLHVHDIYNAILALELDLPWIYNDHEGWSNAISNIAPNQKIYHPYYWRRYIGIKFRRRRIMKWEPQVLKDRITIVVSSKMAKSIHEPQQAKPFVMHNFPLTSELPKDVVEEKDLGSIAYVGKDLLVPSPYHRDTRGFLEIINQNDLKLVVVGDNNLKSYNNIKSYGYVDHSEINSLIESCQFGVVPFRNYPLRRIHMGDHNKIHIYAHLGMMIVGPQTLLNTETIKYVKTFKHFSEIPSLIKQPIQEDPIDIINYARKNLIWEKDEDALNLAVKLVIENAE